MEKSHKLKSVVFPKEMEVKMIKKWLFYECFPKVQKFEKTLSKMRLIKKGSFCEEKLIKRKRNPWEKVPFSTSLNISWVVAVEIIKRSKKAVFPSKIGVCELE